MKDKFVEDRVLWTPDSDYIENSTLTDYMIWLENEYCYNFESYGELWDWSVSAVDEFWESIMEYYRVHYDGKYQKVSSGNMPKVKWFEGIKLSYAEHIFRNYSDDRPALIYRSETENMLEVSWQELVAMVSSLKYHLEQNTGLKEGDRVVAYMTNCPEAVVAFLAVNSIGAVWSSASPDFGVNAVVDRFSQIEAKVLIASTDYNYNGKNFDREKEINKLANELNTVEELILVGSSGFTPSKNFSRWKDIINIETEELSFKRVDFSHPLWVLYSSGTTGLPKAITHSTGGILLEHLKILGIHNNVQEGERFFWYSTTGWMMWNYALSSLLHGATLVIYNGSPVYPEKDSLWKFAEDARINHFGLGAAFIDSCRKEDLKPGTKFSLKNLKTIGSTGSPLSRESFEWVYESVSKNLQLCSISGGSDVCSAFVGPVASRKIYSGEIQARALACDLAVFDEQGEEIVDVFGEMVIKKPMPSMPVYFWGDVDFKRYKESYFEYYPNVWRHGDWTKLSDRETVVILGRSDTTLNRGGVRIGSAEIYRVMDLMETVKDSLVVAADVNKRDLMILFVSSDIILDEEAKTEINLRLREDCSPRHVPDYIIQVSDIPYTISGKKLEKPVTELIKGNANSIAPGSMRNPEIIAEYEREIKKVLN